MFKKLHKKVYILKNIRYMMAIFIVVFLLLIGYARFIEPNLLIYQSVQVETNLPIKSCKIVFFTDTHFGKYTSEKQIEKIVKKINDAQADIVIFGGDLLDNYARDREHISFDYLQEELKKIEAQVGKFAVWGNHDYGGGAVRFYHEFMTNSGFEVLKNDSYTLKDYGIRLIGYDDYLMGWTDPSLYTIESELFNIIVSHEPIVSQFIKSTSENFILSGHTHGGQVTIPFITNKLLPDGAGDFVKGFYTNEEIQTQTQIQMYTSSGIGMTRYPFRFFNKPEIVEVYLQGNLS